MEQFWSIVKSWNNPVGQGIFFLLCLVLFVALFDKICYYITVSVKGWPPPHCVEEKEEEE